ncbi:MAG: hypothetical protein PHF86_07390 [Candidatus Nanoarchaeia archaeon]|nr:hypothetical protein [Candidatus Nanoarchaeia archaeon]
MGKRFFPCSNLLCKINSEGFCDAGDMLELMCSPRDIYRQCKERYVGSIIMDCLKNLMNKQIIKDSKGNFFEQTNQSKKVFKITR